MNFKRFSGSTLGFLAVGCLAWGCSNKADDCNANLSCGPYAGSSGVGGTGAGGSSGVGGKAGASAGGHSGSPGASGNAGTSGDAGSAGAPAVCDPTSSPDADSCVIGDDYALFVSPDGNDADSKGDGTEQKPFATVTKALSVAAAGAIKRIYVCSAQYAEPGTLEIPNRVSIYGGFSCDNGVWSYDAPIKAYLIPASPVGATITSAAQGVTLQDIRIDAADADDGHGASSFGMIILGSKNVVLTRVELNAGKGGMGEPGVDGVVGAPGAVSGAAQNGAAGTCTSPTPQLFGGVPVAAVCTSQGGAGGSGLVVATPDPRQNGGAGFPDGANNGGLGGTIAAPLGSPGAIGSLGADGSVGAAAGATGTFSAAGYQLASGGSGALGAPGQGGGGGGASFAPSGCVGSSGGAGGMGGCGGGAGTGGGGGGASVALLSWNTTLTLDSCKLSATNGGAGGNGGAAQAGGAGTSGGAAGPAVADKGIKGGGKGGDGGGGGSGGNGSGGTGGPSIAFVYGVIAPTQVGTSVFNVPTAGSAPGKGGQFGSSGAWGSDGSKGLVKAQFEQL